MNLEIAIIVNNSRKIELDFVRGIAIILVLGSHYVQPVSGIAFMDWFSATLRAVGGVGVDLFFALSGFLVGGIVLKEYKSTGTLQAKRFLVRRAFKILPPLYVLVLFHVVVGRHPVETFFWQNILQVQNYFGTSIAQTWSLGVEEHFYLLFVCFMVLCIGKSPKFIFWMLVLVCMVSVTARIIAVEYGYLYAAFRQTQFRLDGLLYGVLLAVIFHFYPKIFDSFSRRKGMLIFISVSLAFWIYLTAGNAPLVGSVGLTVQGVGFLAFLIFIYSHSGRQTSMMWYRVIAWLGVYSYGIYLWHTLGLAPGAMLVRNMQSLAISPVLTWGLSLFVQAAVGIGVGVVMTHVVEWPMLRLRERVFPTSV